MPARALKITQCVLHCDDGFMYVIDDQRNRLIFERDTNGFGEVSCAAPRRRKIYSWKNDSYFPRKWERNGERIELYLIKEGWQLRGYRVLEEITSLSFWGRILEKALFWISIPLTLFALWELSNKILSV